MLHRLRQLLWKSPEGFSAGPGAFVATYCTKCKAGWTRTNPKGSLTVCLLDQQPVPPDMIWCDHYDPRSRPPPNLRALKQKAGLEISLPKSKH